MMALPVSDLRRNVLTLAVTGERLPAVVRRMLQLLPAEEYDPEFRGQPLETTYFDTLDGSLRRARVKKKRYLTLRIRCYGTTESYALSAKTEAGKYRTMLESRDAEYFLEHGIETGWLEDLLPADLLARLLELTDGDLLVPAVRVDFTRYAVEDETDRLTLDTTVRTNSGKLLPAHVLEAKTIANEFRFISDLTSQVLPTVKLSKFLWATSFGERQ